MNPPPPAPNPGPVVPPPPVQPPPGIDPRPEPPEPPPIDTITYLIVGNDQNLGAGDQELSDLLDDLEFDTSVLDDAENSREAFDANLIIISESVNAGTINGEYRNEEVPILIMQSEILEDMRMIGQNDDQRINARLVEVEDDGHEIAEAVNVEQGDQVEMSDVNVQLGFGEPGQDAEIVLTQNNNNNNALLFTYEQGDEMDDDQEAPDRRVFFGLPENALDNLAADGDDFLEAAILYTWSGDAEQEPGRRR
jgi:hypothetical protein